MELSRHRAGRVRELRTGIGFGRHHEVVGGTAGLQPRVERLAPGHERVGRDRSFQLLEPARERVVALPVDRGDAVDRDLVGRDEVADRLARRRGVRSPRSPVRRGPDARVPMSPGRRSSTTASRRGCRHTSTSPRRRTRPPARRRGPSGRRRRAASARRGRCRRRARVRSRPRCVGRARSGPTARP